MGHARIDRRDGSFRDHQLRLAKLMGALVLGAGNAAIGRVGPTRCRVTAPGLEGSPEPLVRVVRAAGECRWSTGKQMRETRPNRWGLLPPASSSPGATRAESRGYHGCERRFGA
jgi:hypothetical protein